jgi:muramidase (phage lysozyme)
MANNVVYNPDDNVQTSFLSALALGETGNSSYASTEGFGGVNLAGDTDLDSVGFPIQAGGNVSSAAGTYQFVKGTYDNVAAQLGLDNSFSQSDQNEAAWQLAQTTYTQKTGGSLYQALQSGNYSSIQSALASVWPSVSGNGAAPQGLAASLAGGQGANVPFPARAPRPAQVVHQPAVRKDFWAILRTGSKGSGLSPSEGLS